MLYNAGWNSRPPKEGRAKMRCDRSGNICERCCGAVFRVVNATTERCNRPSSPVNSTRPHVTMASDFAVACCFSRSGEADFDLQYCGIQSDGPRPWSYRMCLRVLLLLIRVLDARTAAPTGPGTAEPPRSGGRPCRSPLAARSWLGGQRTGGNHMSIFVIGGAGFIGIRLIPLLVSRGAQVTCMDINPQSPV